MTLPIGNKLNQKGLTLIEILLTVTIISLATVYIVQTNLLNLSVLGRYANRLTVQQWALEKIAETKDLILTSESPDTGLSSGTFESESRSYKWKLEVEEEFTKQGSIYFMDLDVNWSEPGQAGFLERHAAISKVQTT